nr:IclR family transcriptional regulator [Phytoactinopolyspora halotolerans]
MTERQFQPVKSADRTLEILEVLADSTERLSLAHLARALSIPKSSLHGILRTMVQRGWAETDPSGTYFGLGVRALLVGASYVDRDDVVSRTQPLLDRLGAETGETTHLGRLDGSDVVYLAKHESPHPLRMFSAIGRRVPAHSTALGKSLLAERSDAAVADLLPRPLPRLTANTVTDLETLLGELARVRATGHAADREESSDGICCFAVALPTTRPAVDALSVSIPAFRLDDEVERRVVDALTRVRDQFRRSAGAAVPT